MTPEEIRAVVVEEVAYLSAVAPEKMKDEHQLGADLDLDSLDQIEVVMALEDRFNGEISDAEAEKLKTIGDVVNYIQAHVK